MLIPVIMAGGSGTAKLTKGDKTDPPAGNASIHAPAGEVHALENPGVIPLHIIGIRTGSDLGQDDIVRFGDRCGHGGRASK